MLTPPRELDLATLDRHFTVRGHDALLGALAPPLLARVEQRAPLVTISLLAETDTDRSDLARGHVDMSLGSSVPEGTQTPYEVLGEDRMTLAMRRGHPMAGRRLILERLAAMDH